MRCNVAVACFLLPRNKQIEEVGIDEGIVSINHNCNHPQGAPDCKFLVEREQCNIMKSAGKLWSSHFSTQIRDFMFLCLLLEVAPMFQTARSAWQSNNTNTIQMHCHRPCRQQRLDITLLTYGIGERTNEANKRRCTRRKITKTYSLWNKLGAMMSMIRCNGNAPPMHHKRKSTLVDYKIYSYFYFSATTIASNRNWTLFMWKSCLVR